MDPLDKCPRLPADFILLFFELLCYESELCNENFIQVKYNSSISNLENILKCENLL